jgi:hypothetical protein
MRVFRTYCLVIFAALAVFACKSKKVSLSGEDPVEVGDFIDFFPESKLPYRLTDTFLLKKNKDSLLISQKVFSQFVPDSIIARSFPKNAKLKIYPMARIKAVKTKETYLFAKVLSGDKHAAFVLGFNKNDEFIDGIPLLQLDNSSATTQTADIDTRYVLSSKVTRRNRDGSTSDGSDQYVLNNDGGFTLILTEALEDKPTELINPIETYSHKQKFTADYGSGTMNLVSFRDGRKTDRLTFFIHFEKNKGECIGELKGEARIVTSTMAEYREPGDPCTLQFNFSSSSVSIKEVGGCGSRRGLRCSFNGSYPRKKEAKPKAVMKAKKR